MFSKNFHMNSSLCLDTRCGWPKDLSEEFLSGAEETLRFLHSDAMKDKLCSGLKTPVSACIPRKGMDGSACKVVDTPFAADETKRLPNKEVYEKAIAIIDQIKADPYRVSPAYRQLIGPLDGLYSRAIDTQHSLIYQVYRKTKTIKIISIINEQ